MLKIGILLLCLGTTSGCTRLTFTEVADTANGYHALKEEIRNGRSAAMKTQTVLCPKNEVVTGVEAKTETIHGKEDRIYTLRCEGRCWQSGGLNCGFAKHWKYYYSRWSGKDEKFDVGFDDYKTGMNVKALIGFQSKLSDDKDKDDKETVYRSFRFFYAETTEWYYHDYTSDYDYWNIPLLEWKTEKDWNKIMFNGRSWNETDKKWNGRNSAYDLKSYRKDGMRQFEFKTAHSSKEKH